MAPIGSIKCLNAWSLFGGTVLEGLKGVALVEEVGLEVSKVNMRPSHSQCLSDCMCVCLSHSHTLSCSLSLLPSLPPFLHLVDQM